MFNVAVIRLKDLVRSILLIIGIIIIGLIAKKYIENINLNKLDIGKKISSNIDQYAEHAMSTEIPEMKQLQENEKQTEENKEKEDFYKRMINLQIGAIKAKKTKQDEVKVEKESAKKEEKTEQKNEEEEKIELAKKDVKTEVTTKNPLVEKYTKKYKGVKIRNETSYDLTDEDINYDKLKIDKSNIIIFHTHTCESYTESEKYSYTPTGNFRTTDKKYSVVKVGDRLTKYLKKYKLNIIHDSTYHDYPAYTGSYSRSAKTVSNLLGNTKADIIIDLHRDAIGSNSSYAPTVKIGDETCAQLMFVMGSNGGKLKHDNWKQNLQFAVKLQELANKTYPGLFKPIILRNSRYNQNLGKAACIIEVGSTGNTLEQALNSMKYLAEIINEFQ